MTTTTDPETIDVAGLSAAIVGNTPTDFEYDDEKWPESWDYVPVVRCEHCRAVIIDTDDHLSTIVDENGTPVLRDGAEVHATEADKDDWDLADGEEWDDCDAADQDASDLDAGGPWMNYWYPAWLRFGETAEDLARATVDSVLVVVTRNDGDEVGFALGGGGMDLSWEICEGYMSAGLLPPFTFCDLPAMGGLSATPKTLAVIAACKRTAECIADRARYTTDRLDRLQADLRPVTEEG